VIPIESSLYIVYKVTKLSSASCWHSSNSTVNGSHNFPPNAVHSPPSTTIPSALLCRSSLHNLRMPAFDTWSNYCQIFQYLARIVCSTRPEIRCRRLGSPEIWQNRARGLQSCLNRRREGLTSSLWARERVLERVRITIS
jgi:hypothetical protein